MWRMQKHERHVLARLVPELLTLQNVESIPIEAIDIKLSHDILTINVPQILKGREVIFAVNMKYMQHHKHLESPVHW
jgi:hypothetical protein